MNDDNRIAALEYLSEVLANDAPSALQHEATFTGEPLEGEGEMSIFAFDASIGGEPSQRYRVVTGKTQPNYYPHWGITPEQAYEVHLGTRFMLVMEVATVPVERVSGEHEEKLREFITSVAPGEPVNDVTAAAAFCVGSELHVVYRANVANEDIYVLGGDCPPGAYRDTHLPPHVVFRRHIGRHIRAESETESSD